MYTVGSAWFAGEETIEGRTAPGQFAGIALLSADDLTLPEDEIAAIESALTISGGEIVYRAGGFADLAPELPPVSPDWSPVAVSGRYKTSTDED